MRLPVGHVRLLQTAALVCLLSAGAPAGGAGAATGSADQLAGSIRAALQHSDLTALQSLVTWDGASAFKRRLVLYEMRRGFGRPIKSVTVEAIPPESLTALAELGDFKANMDVKNRIRVVFDEPPMQDGHAPDMLFLVGQQAQSFKIALVNPLKPSRQQ